MENRTAMDTGFISQLSMGGTLAAFSAARWALALTRDLGYKPTEGLGMVVGFGIALAFLAAILVADFLLARLLPKIIRSSLWLSAMIGPYLGLVIYEQFHSPVWGQVAGAFATVALFPLFYLLERRLMK